MTKINNVMGLFRGFCLSILRSCLCAYLIYNVASPYECSANTLNSTVRHGDIVLCDQWMHTLYGLKKGDVVATSTHDTDYIYRFPFYRVVALEGEGFEKLKVPPGKVLLEREALNKKSTFVFAPYSSIRGKAYLKVLPNLKSL